LVIIKPEGRGNGAFIASFMLGEKANTPPFEGASGKGAQTGFERGQADSYPMKLKLGRTGRSHNRQCAHMGDLAVLGGANLIGHQGNDRDCIAT